MDTSKNTVLIFSDHKEKWESLCAYLEKRGYGLCFLDDENEVFRKLQSTSSSADLLLLDHEAKDMDHLEFIRHIKQIKVLPVILADGPASTTERTLAFEMGADDYFSTALEVEEMAARIKASLRLVEEVEDDIQESNSLAKKGCYVFSDWVLDMDQCTLYDKNEREISLTKGEFDLLSTFVQAPGRALSRDQLFDMARDREYEGFDRSIDVQVSRLREKLGEKNNDENSADGSDGVLRTVRGIGYMLDAQVKKI